MDAEMVGWGAGFARVEGILGEPSRETLEIVLTAPGTTAGGARKRIRVNGVPRRTTALPQSLPAVLFAPEDMLLVVGAPGLRRALLDDLIVQRSVTAASSLSTYARALAQRNSLLRRIREEEASRDELPYWDDLIVREGGRIVSWRLEAIEALGGPLAAAHREIADEEGTLGLHYVTNAPTQDDETPTDALRRRLSETVEKQLWNGATLVGPHRDDVSFELDGRDLSTFASRGQQRTAILALKLAQVELVAAAAGRLPLLLLDDVFSELDPIRRSHLVRRISGLPQAFITTTTPNDLDPALVAASTAWRVEAGQLHRED
jgi:DNA replication and repair protein RecF